MKKMTNEELIRAIHQLHAIIVGTAQNELDLDVPTGGGAESVAESVEILKTLGLQDDFTEEQELIEQMEACF
jgi:hypothetical protein